MFKIMQTIILFSFFLYSSIFSMGQVVQVGRSALIRTIHQTVMHRVAHFRHSKPIKCPLGFLGIMSGINQETMDQAINEANQNALVSVCEQETKPINLEQVAEDKADVAYFNDGHALHGIAFDPATGQHWICFTLDPKNASPLTPEQNKEVLQYYIASLHGTAGFFDASAVSSVKGQLFDEHIHAMQTTQNQACSSYREEVLKEFLIDVFAEAQGKKFFSEIVKLADRIQNKSFSFQASQFMHAHESWANHAFEKFKKNLLNELSALEGQLSALIYKNQRIAYIIQDFRQNSSNHNVTINHAFLEKNGLQGNVALLEALDKVAQIEYAKSVIEQIDHKFAQESCAFKDQLQNANGDILEKTLQKATAAKENIANQIVESEKTLQVINNQIKDINNTLDSLKHHGRVKRWLTGDLTKENLETELQKLNKKYETIRKEIIPALQYQKNELNSKIAQIDNVIHQKQEIAAQQNREQEAQRLQEQQEAEILEYEQLQNQYNSLTFNTDTCSESVQIDRQNAFDQTEKDGYASYDQQYVLSPQAAAFLHTCGMSYGHLHNFTGTAFQHQLHGEYCNIIELAAEQQMKLHGQDDIWKQCGFCADAAHEANISGQIQTTMVLNDLGCALLEYGKAIGIGAVQGVQASIHSIVHLDETIKSVAKAVYYVGETIALNNYSEEYGFEDLYIPLRDQRNAEIVAGLKHLGNAFLEMSGPERVQTLTKFATDFAISGKIMKVIGGVVDIAKSEAIADAAKIAHGVEVAAPEGKLCKAVRQDLLNAEKNLEKGAKVFSGASSEIIQQSKGTPPRTFADKKASALTKAQVEAEIIKNLPDGRVRYYTAETASKTDGPTRGSRIVTEYNPKTDTVRLWMECYDEAGNVNRVRPKMIDGRTVWSQHYPATHKDIQAGLKGSRWV